MNPRPELDRLIAEKVMGWTLYHYDKDVAANCYYCLFDADGDAVVFSPRPGLYVTEFKTAEEAYAQFAPSTNIAHAWEVVKKLAGQDFRMGRTETGKFYVNFGHQVMNEVGDTAPHVICLAALAAVGVEA